MFKEPFGVRQENGVSVVMYIKSVGDKNERVCSRVAYCVKLPYLIFKGFRNVSGGNDRKASAALSFKILCATVYGFVKPYTLLEGKKISPD